MDASRWRSATRRSAKSASACQRLVPRDLNQSLTPAAVAAGIALLLAVVTSLLLAQVVLRPMHVIRSSLSRLGRGDLGATLDLRDDASSASWVTCSTRSARNCGRPPGGIEAGAAGGTVTAHRDGRPPDRRRRARDEESAQRDDHSSRAAEAEARGRASRRRARRDHRAGDPAARRSHPGVSEVRPARRSDVRAGARSRVAVERARCGLIPRRSAPA